MVVRTVPECSLSWVLGNHSFMEKTSSYEYPSSLINSVSPAPRTSPLEVPYLYLCSNPGIGITEEDLLRMSSVTDISTALLAAEGAWSVIYYRPDLSALFIGRDCFGRFSLVFSQSNQGIHVSCVVQQNESDGEWSEVPYASLSVIHLGAAPLSMEFHHLIQEYPNSEARNWLNLFTATQHYVPKDSLLKVSRVVSSSDNEIDISRELFSRTVNACRRLLQPAESHAVVCFSGGIDSVLVTLSLHSAAPPDLIIDLVNVAFGDDQQSCSAAPDRIRALRAFKQLSSEYPERKWRLILANITREELNTCREQFIARVAEPASSVLDDSLACVLWFAIRASGQLFDLNSGVFGDEVICSPSSSAFVGSGADELFAGYARHRTAYERHGYEKVAEECEAELLRLGSRNGGRDARVAAQHGRKLCAPLLDDSLVEWSNNLPILAKSDLALPRGQGEKIIIRRILSDLHFPSDAPKQAMQFGSRMAKIDNAHKNVKGSDASTNIKRVISPRDKDISVSE